MKRRNFLTLFSSPLLSYMANTFAAAATPKRIIVIGAGLAGLAAARELQQLGHEVVIVEARQRIGGRIWTSNHWPDMPLDLGATWIHGVQGNPLTALADTIQAQRLVTRYLASIAYNTSGLPLTTAEEERLDNVRTQVFSILQNAQNQDPDQSLRQTLSTLLQSVDESSETYRFINFILSSEIEQEYSGSANQLSTHWYDSGAEFAGDDALFAQGFHVITDYLAQGLAIELGQVVKEIQWQQTPARVITQQTTFEAEHIIVTLPLGVLQATNTIAYDDFEPVVAAPPSGVLQAQSIRFSPALPMSKQEAIAKLGMGVLNKCYLRFQQAFWPDDVDWLEYVSANHGEWTEWVSFKQAANLPVLLGFNAADYGKTIETKSDQQIVASAMHTLKTIFGAAIPDPIDFQITRWASDPFSLGSYSYNAVGSTPTLRDVLAAPLGNTLFFAGEACHKDYFGTAHGAYLSGLRAAAAVQQT